MRELAPVERKKNRGRRDGTAPPVPFRLRVRACASVRPRENGCIENGEMSFSLRDMLLLRVLNADARVFYNLTYSVTFLFWSSFM